jgi:hypothetical protein
MEIPKEQILQMLRSRGEDQKADQADGQLPDKVDPEQHAGMLEKLGINPQDILSQFGGAGGVAGKLGL